MPYYRFTTEDAYGKAVVDHVEAESPQNAIEVLSAQNLFPIDIEELTPEEEAEYVQSKSVKGVIWRALDYLEAIILRMLTGVFHFIFRKIPRWIYDFLIEWLPTLVKATRVFTFATVLVITVAGPAAIGFYWFQSKSADTSESPPQHNELVEQWVTYGSYAWTALAVCGASWGFMYIKRRAKGLWSAIKSAITKRDTELELDDPSGDIVSEDVNRGTEVWQNESEAPIDVVDVSAASDEACDEEASEETTEEAVQPTLPR